MTNANSESSQKWIGVFHAEWPVQKHTLYLLNGLASEGYQVDLFCYRAPFIHEPETDCDSENIHIHVFHPLDSVGKENNSLFKRARRRFQLLSEKLQQKYLLLRQNYTTFIPSKVSRTVIEENQNKKYICFIGVEKLGLVWAAQIAQPSKTPYLYYSLELYTSQHPYSHSSDRLRRLKIAEAQYFRQSTALLIQDELRANVLLKDNQISSHPTIFLPISSTGNCSSKSSNYLRERFDLPDDSVLLLQFGQMARYGKELIQLAQALPDNHQIILHDGLIKNLWNQTELISKFKEIDKKSKVILSLETLNSEQIQAMIESSDIGLVLYSGKYDNDRLTIFSSEKLALYLQCSLPIIGFDHPGYELLENTRSGVLIREITDIPCAVQKILEDHAEYRSNARKLFLDKYKFEQNFQALSRYLKELN